MYKSLSLVTVNCIIAPYVTSNTHHPAIMISAIKQVLNPFIPGTAVFKLPSLCKRDRDASKRTSESVVTVNQSTQVPPAAPRAVTIEDLDHLFPTLKDYQRRLRGQENELDRPPLVEDQYEHPALAYYENLHSFKQSVTQAGPTDYKMELNKEGPVAEKESDQKSVSEWSMVSMTKEKTGDSKIASDDKSKSKKHGKPSDGSKKEQVMSNKNESNMSLESAILVNALGNQSTDSLAASIGTQSSASFGDTSGDIGGDDVPVYMRLDFWNRCTIIEETEEQLVSLKEKAVVLSVRDEASLLGNSMASLGLSASSIKSGEQSNQSHLDSSMSSSILAASNRESGEQSKESRLSTLMVSPNPSASNTASGEQSKGSSLSTPKASTKHGASNIASGEQSKESCLSTPKASPNLSASNIASGEHKGSRLSTPEASLGFGASITVPGDKSEGARLSSSTASIGHNSWNIVSDEQCKESRLSDSEAILSFGASIIVPGEESQGARLSSSTASLGLDSWNIVSDEHSEGSRLSFTAGTLTPDSSTPLLRKESSEKSPSADQPEGSRLSFTFVSLSPNSSTPLLRKEKDLEESQSAGHSSVSLPGSSAAASIHSENRSKADDKGDDKGDSAEGDAKEPEATPPVARKPYKDPTLWVRGFTGTLLKGAAPGEPARPDDSRSWDCKILWCIECHGPCPICGKPCCVRWGCDQYMDQPIAHRDWLKSRRCFMVTTLLDRYGNLTRDHSTYTVCTEPGGCGRYVCSDCCGICSTPMCRDIQCKDCKPNPWGPCDWHAS
ncbi:hypothetical protein ASPACDRAFT_58435 [Aspergillus aculeatus ATCC 16872]|uniref:Uncharacterized protein n=1 Tax=Aspergillus aculeatus (strain ATCC 16872 / CBS 172.66 / WB 5094) TaxID=690307 RepID=A0A1L9X0V9_ASPA1|nr:uncharacterized protein ASPACDRAFT_58435 [Aspergillus aculeatus ATCC 16872]OJK02053.1 hypothetical protein ASPACDRAFT_58435 [Aspergillus aculeatus ATCC 16872]